MVSVLHSQYHAWWCPVDFRGQGINRHGIDLQSQNIPSPASEELWYINLLIPGWCGCDLKNAIFKRVLVIGILKSSYESFLRLMLQNLSDDKSTLVQVTVTWANVDQIFADIWPHYATRNSNVIIYLPYFHKSQMIFYFSSSCSKSISNMRKIALKICITTAWTYLYASLI